MSTKPQTERRWLRSVLAASSEPMPAFPWARGQRRKPSSLLTEDDAPATTRTRLQTTFGTPTAIAAQ